MARTLEQKEVLMLAADLLNLSSERDRQVVIGASQIGNPCDYCLAHKMSANGQQAIEGNPYWLGARIGTAIHSLIEENIEKQKSLPQEAYKFTALDGALVEQKIVIGELEGYGIVRSKPDLVLTKHNHLIDWKTTTKAKAKNYKYNGVPNQYVVQQQLYAWGLNKSGIKIEEISLVFVARDGTSEKDIYVYSFPYDETIALKYWGRMETIYHEVQSGKDLEEYESDYDCFHCNVVIRRL